MNTPKKRGQPAPRPNRHPHQPANISYRNDDTGIMIPLIMMSSSETGSKGLNDPEPQPDQSPTDSNCGDGGGDGGCGGGGD